MESIGIDVHKVNSQICVVGENAEVLEERRIQTDRERFAAVMGKRPKARVLIEASTESEWVVRCLEGDTRPKRETRPGLERPGRHRASALLYW